MAYSSFRPLWFHSRPAIIARNINYETEESTCKSLCTTTFVHIKIISFTAVHNSFVSSLSYMQLLMIETTKLYRYSYCICGHAVVMLCTNSFHPHTTSTLWRVIALSIWKREDAMDLNYDTRTTLDENIKNLLLTTYLYVPVTVPMTQDAINLELASISTADDSNIERILCGFTCDVSWRVLKRRLLFVGLE